MYQTLYFLDFSHYENTPIQIQYSSGKRTKKLFIPNIGVSRTSKNTRNQTE